MEENFKFEMVAKTFHGLEEVLAEELRGLGAINVEPGRRMVSFEGDKAMLYRANMCCRTALRILKPIYKFVAHDADDLYEMVKEFDWTQVLSLDKTFSLDTVSNSDEFTHSRYVTYRVKDAIVDFFKDRFGADKRPGVRLQDADVMINVHISGERVTLSLDSSGESLHKRGYRVAQTEAPINEVLAAGIILKSGWRGDCPFVDPMCGSGTFLIEAALIGAGIMPGIYRKRFAFESWKDFDAELFDSIYNDESEEKDLKQCIYGCDISPKAVAIAEKNIKQAGVGKYINLKVKPLVQWEEAPEDGILVTNPPYGERIGSEDMEGLYRTIGTKLKRVFTGYHAWIIGYREEYFNCIGLSPSVKETIYNGALECELREYIIFDGDYESFRKSGRSLRESDGRGDRKLKGPRRMTDEEWKRDARKKGFGGKESHSEGNFRKRTANDSRKVERHNRLEDNYRPKKGRFAQREQEQQDSENPFAHRRNESALNQIVGKQPSLPPVEGGLMMRSRKGWKKK